MRHLVPTIRLAVLCLTMSGPAHGWTASSPVLPGSQDRLSGRIVLDSGGNSHVAWHEKVGGYYQAHYTSGDAGSFVTPVVLSQGGAVHCYGPVLAVDAAAVHCAWTSDQSQNNNFEIWYRRRTLNGWGAILNASNTSIKSLGQAVAVRAPVGPIVAWHEALYADDNYDVMYAEWNGSSFSGAVNLSNTPGGKVYGSVAPAAAISPNGDVTVVWPDSITGSYHFNARRRVNGVWSARQEISTKPTGPGPASIAVSADNQVHIAYAADPAAGVSDITVWYQKWNGSAWTAPVDLSRGFPNFWRCSLAVDAQGFVHVVADNAQGNPQGEIWYATNRSGAWSNWQNISQTPTRSSSPVIAHGGGRLAVIWSDDGNGSGGASGFANVWYTRMALEPTGPAGTVTGTVRDQLGNPLANATLSSGIYETASSESGSYSLLLPVGTHDVACGKRFYAGSVAHGISVSQDQATALDFAITGEPPAPVGAFAVVQGNRVNTLNWTAPADASYSGTMIRFKHSGFPVDPADGTLLADQSGSPDSSDSFEHSGLANGVPCYYAAFAYFRDAGTYFAAGVNASGTPAGPGDMDRDGDVDQGDFGSFQACLSGAFVPQTVPACAYARLDGDSDVDGDDLGVFAACISGPGVPSASDCGR